MRRILFLILLLLQTVALCAQVQTVTRKPKKTTSPVVAQPKPKAKPTAKPKAKQKKVQSTPKHASSEEASLVSDSIAEFEPAIQPEVPEKDSVAIIIENLLANMVHVDGGTFMMGATKEQPQKDVGKLEKPVHQVTLSDYYIGKYEVTQEEWFAVMDSNPSYFKGPRCPVEQVSWDDCQEFIKRLNAMTGLTFRLPTEAEWEFAARGGNKSRGYMYAGSNDVESVAWKSYSSQTQTHPVGEKLPNELGLYDMSGNVQEWCNDWSGRYSSKPQTNPQGSSSDMFRSFRGGGWGSDSEGCRVSDRSLARPSDRSLSRGFRLAL